MTPLVNRLNTQRGILAETQAALESVADLLDTENKPYLTEGDQPAPPLQKEIQFESVDFAYVPTERVLTDITFSIQHGKTTALVGASGAGKSTLADLVPRFYDPTAGRILYDGIDLRDLTVRSLRDRIAIVSQNTHIFNDTVAANIAYGTPDTNFARIREVAEQANALEFIEDLEEGFDTVLGERGVRLSGGQRQRIAIARAILEDPEILILDEATSSLDSISEKLVQQSLQRLMSDRTVLAIAHRLSTIENADWVVVLEDGEIVEQGTYADLIERRGQLWEYHSVQYQMAGSASPGPNGAPVSQ
jgi:subfamily B ATP-binding cassette protein MsbA